MDENIQNTEEVQPEVNPVEESLRNTIKEQNRSHSVELELVRSCAKSVKAAVSLMDVSRMETDENGVCTNAAELVSALKSEYPWLFGQDSPGISSTGIRHTPSSVRDDSKLTDAEYYELYCK